MRLARNLRLRPRTPPLRLLRLANPLVASVLRSPAHGLLSNSLMLLTYRGRSSGRERTIPVMYAPHDGAVVALAAGPEAKQWWRAFRGGASATLTIAGRPVEGRGALLRGVAAEEALHVYLARFPRARRTIEARGAAIVSFAPDEAREAIRRARPASASPGRRRFPPVRRRTAR